MFMKKLVKSKKSITTYGTFEPPSKKKHVQDIYMNMYIYST